MIPALRNSILICLLILAGADARAQRKGYDHWGYPVFDSVVSYLSTRVDMDSITGYLRLRLAKKPDGWYFYTTDYSVTPHRLGKEIKCWDRAKDRYVYGAGKSYTIDKKQALKQFKKVLDEQGVKHDYSYEPYFGYRGWTNDVYALLAGKATMSDDELHGLARAYGSEMGYRWGSGGDYSYPEFAFDPGDYPGHMTAAQIDTFKKYNGLEVQTYRRLWKQNPNYVTFVGNVWVKYSNEVVNAYMEMTFRQSKEEGSKQLTKEELYDPVTLAFAQNLLSSCDKDAILFTQGDNDTYPLIYLQAVKGVRPDVLIVNLSLLALPLYINAQRAGMLGNSTIPMRLEASEYQGTKLDVLRPGEEDYSRFQHVEGIPDRIKAPYLLKNDIALIDILNANQWKRPVSFAMTVSPDAFLGLDKYLRYHGFVYQLTTAASQGSSEDLDTAFNYDFYMNKMAVTDWGKQTFTDEISGGMSTNECGVMILEAQLLKDIGEDKKCLALLDKLMQAFPAEKVKRDVFFASVPELYYSCGQKTKASTLAAVILEEARKGYNKYIKDNDIGAGEWNNKIRGYLYIYQELDQFYTNHTEYEAMSKTLKKEFEDKRAEYGRVLVQKGID